MRPNTNAHQPRPPHELQKLDNMPFRGAAQNILVRITRYYSAFQTFNQYVFFFSKQCTYCKTNAIYT